MAQNTNGGKLTVSQEFLRAEINELKLWMVTAFAPKTEVIELQQRVRKLEDELIGREALAETTKITLKKNSRKQNTITGAVAFIIALVTTLREAGIF